MATVEGLCKEIKDSSAFLAAQGDDGSVDAMRTSMAQSLAAQITTLRSLRTDQATALTTEINESVYTPTERDRLRTAVTEKLLTGAASARKEPEQRFAVPMASQHLFPESNWETFRDPTKSLSLKQQTMADTLSSIGFINPDQCAKCDLAVVLYDAHFQRTASPKALYNLANDIKLTFSQTPRRAPHLTHLVVFPSVEALPDTHKAGYAGDEPVLGTITDWQGLRSHIAARRNSKLLREGATLPGKGSTALALPFQSMNPFDIFRMGMMMAGNNNTGSPPKDGAAFQGSGRRDDGDMSWLSFTSNAGGGGRSSGHGAGGVDPLALEDKRQPPDSSSSPGGGGGAPPRAPGGSGARN